MKARNWCSKNIFIFACGVLEEVTIWDYFRLPRRSLASVHPTPGWESIQTEKEIIEFEMESSQINFSQIYQTYERPIFNYILRMLQGFMGEELPPTTLREKLKQKLGCDCFDFFLPARSSEHDKQGD